MRPGSFVARVAPVVALAASYAAALFACGGGGGAAAGDAGADASIWAFDDATADSALPPYDADAAAPVDLATLYVVHASADAPPLRFCLGVSTDAGSGASLGGGRAPTPDVLGPALPFAGLPAGAGAPLDTRGADLAPLALEVFALDATRVPGGDAGTAAACEELLGGDGLGALSDAGGSLTPGRDYWHVGSIAAGQLAPGTRWLALVTGCLPGEARADTSCPQGYDPTQGDLTLSLLPLDVGTAVGPSAIGVQFVQGSSEWENQRRAAGATTTAGFFRPGDAGAPDASPSPWAGWVEVPVTTDAGYAAITPSPLATLDGVTFDGTTAFGATLLGGDAGDPSQSPLAMLLPAVQAASWSGGAPEAGVLRDGAGFVFVLVGDPGASSPWVDPYDGGPSKGPDAGGIPNGHLAHFLAFPVHP